MKDYFQRNRTPYTDPLSRGAIVGLTLVQGLPHVVRAVMRISASRRAILDAFGRARYKSSKITVGGGAAAPDL
ncbi:FGGY-family carbohydrate kinase [Rubellimicrobium roseum]|uniref:FGGY-family carbohydrate kinase n=1 Tax=Rubellimicrobium roseum TaxID=687525 RepID=UPI001FE34D56